MDVRSQAPFTANFVKSVLAAGTATTLSQTTAAHYAIRGKIYKQDSAWSNQATPTTDANTAAAFTGVLANYGSIFIIGVNAAGTMKVAQGGISALDATGAFINAPSIPALPDDFCPLGYLVIKAGSTANNTTGWVFGTNNMSSVTGITYSFADLCNLPDRLQIS